MTAKSRQRKRHKKTKLHPTSHTAITTEVTPAGQTLYHNTECFCDIGKHHFAKEAES